MASGNVMARLRRKKPHTRQFVSECFRAYQACEALRCGDLGPWRRLLIS
jgi:hypothetical protein